MIHRVSSSLPSFKTLDFGPNINVLLADRSPTASEGQTRNGAGKSSLVEILHFALGAALTELFSSSTLLNHDVSVSFDLPYGQVTATRSGSDAGRTYVVPSALNFTISPQHSKKAPRPHFSTSQWRNVLGASFFGLSLEPEAGAPSFRGLLAYLARRVSNGGIDLPHRNSRDQQTSNIQVLLSFVFDLDYKLPMALEGIRQRERGLRELRKVANSGALGPVLQSSALLRPRLADLEATVQRRDERLRSFKVLEAYREIEKQVTELRKRLRDIGQANLIDQERLVQIREALVAEPDVEETLVESMFRELNDLMPTVVRRRLDEVSAFHRSVVKNRRSTLEREISETEERISARLRDGEAADNERAALMRTLQGAGALEDYNLLSQQLSRAQQELVLLRDQFSRAVLLEGGGSKLEAERKSIEVRTREDHATREARLEQAALMVRELVRSLYDDRQGNLVIDVGPNGPLFKIEIDGDRSEGIARMEIWCFDMLISALLAERKLSPGFLVHDSHVFDGVDERQVSTALRIGLEYSVRFGFQYIVTMNSDIFDLLNVPDEIKTSVLSTRLTDERSDGGLFGVIIDDGLVSTPADDTEAFDSASLSLFDPQESPT